MSNSASRKAAIAKPQQSLEPFGHRTNGLLAAVDRSRPWWAVTANPILRFIAKCRAQLRIRRASKELMSLDDRLLADIGLARTDIEYAARYGRLPISRGMLRR